jgi:hypothetical protein
MIRAKPAYWHTLISHILFLRCFRVRAWGLTKIYKYLLRVRKKRHSAQPVTSNSNSQGVIWNRTWARVLSVHTGAQHMRGRRADSVDEVGILKEEWSRLKVTSGLPQSKDLFSYSKTIYLSQKLTIRARNIKVNSVKVIHKLKICNPAKDEVIKFLCRLLQKAKYRNYLIIGINQKT